MIRAKDIFCINESDVLRRNPLQPTYRREPYGTSDSVVVDDSGDDLSTLDGRINARGRAEPVRAHYVDDARRLDNRRMICDTYIPILNELKDKLSQEGFTDLKYEVESIIEGIESEVEPGSFDQNQIDVRRPIHVGDPILNRRDYYGNERAWSN